MADRVEEGVLVKAPAIPGHLRRRVDGSDPAVDVYQGPDATLRTDGWTRHVLKREVESDGAFASAVRLNVSPIWATLLRELFGEIYDPTLPEVPEPEYGPGAAYVRTVRTRAHEVPQWDELAATCAADGFRAGLAIDTIASALAEDFPPPPDEPSDERDEAKKNAEALQAMADQGKVTQQEADEIGAEMAAMAAAAEAINGDRLRQAIGGAVDEVLEGFAAEDASVRGIAGAGWGAGRGNPIDVVGPRQTLVDAMRTDETLRRIVELAGRMREFVKDARNARTRHIPEEVVDVEVGGDWARFVGAELANLADPDRELYLMRRAIERGVLQYAMEGHEQVARGPIVFCLDESGSMDGRRHEYAKAAAFCMAEVAGRQRRPFSLLHFSWGVDRTDHYRPPAPMHVDRLIEMLSHFSGGGTHIAMALHAACELIESDHRMGKADIVLLSDGCDSVAEEALDRCDAANARVHGLAVGVPFPSELKDRCVTYAELAVHATGFEGLKDLFQKV